jgi:ABC-type glycerol-3-phosphate transport system substrate-binding protein
MFTLRVCYNRDLLREVTGGDEPPRTWRGFLALCDAVRAHAWERNRTVYPIANSLENCHYMASAIMQALGGPVNARLDRDHSLQTRMEEGAAGYLDGEWTYRTPEIANALRVFRAIGDNSQPGFVQVGRNSALLDFFRGRALMVCVGSWEGSSLLKEAPFTVGAFRLPLPGAEDPEFGPHVLGPLSDGRVNTGMPFYLNKDSPNQALALDFLRFLTSVEGNRIFAETSQWLPAIRGVRPGPFAAQFKPEYDGYCWDPDGSVFFSGTGNEMGQVFMRELNQLFGPGGSVRAVQDALERSVPEAACRDLKAYLRDARQSFNAEDAGYAARLRRVGAGPGASAPGPLLEARYFQVRALLARTPPNLSR